MRVSERSPPNGGFGGCSAGCQCEARAAPGSLAGLAGAVATQLPASLGATDKASAVVVFNPAIGRRTDFASAIIEAPSDSGEFDLLDENGGSVPIQSQGVGSGKFAADVDGLLCWSKGLISAAEIGEVNPEVVEGHGEIRKERGVGLREPPTNAGCLLGGP